MIVTCGVFGVLVGSKDHLGVVSFEYFSAPSVEVKNATGAGDTLAAALIHGILQHRTLKDAIRLGIEAAALSLQSEDRTVSPHLIHSEAKQHTQ